MSNRFDPLGIRTIGGRWELAVSIVGNEAQPLDLTTAGIRATISTGAGATPLLTKASTPTSPHADIIFADQGAEPGVVSITFLPAETALFPVLPGRQLYYRVWVTFNAQNQDAVADGFITVQK